MKTPYNNAYSAWLPNVSHDTICKPLYVIQVRSYMKIAFYIIGIYLFGLWLYVVIVNIQKIRQVKQIKGLEECDNYYDVKEIVEKTDDTEYKKLLLDLEKFKKLSLRIWFISIVLSALILLIIATVSK